MDFPHRKFSARYPTDLGAWQALKKHYRDSMRTKDLRSLFTRDKKRAARFTLTAGDLTLDYSKNHVNATTRKLLVRLAKEAQVPAASHSSLNMRASLGAAHEPDMPGPYKMHSGWAPRWVA